MRRWLPCVCRRSASFIFFFFVARVERSETRERQSSRTFVPGFRCAQPGLRNGETAQRKTERQAPPLPFLGPNRFRASRDHILLARTPFSFARGKTRAPRCAARTGALAASAPAKRGRGTTGARAASEPWWRGRRTRSFVSGAENSRRKKKRAREHVRRSPKFPRRVESCAPSTTLLRRVVPLPRYRGGG